VFTVLKSVPLEDELGDVLEKAMRRAGLTVQLLSAKSGVGSSAINDAINYRSELTIDELRRLSTILGLNEVGFCALGCGSYPLPTLGALPFCVYPLRMAYGIGFANAYIVAECGASRGVLFDSGPGIGELRKVWPTAIKQLDAIFLTHAEGEHVGGLCEAIEQFGASAAYCPVGVSARCGTPVGEGSETLFPTFRVKTFSTPGHASAHNCYLVEATRAVNATPLLMSGDLFFAGSVGVAHFCQLQLAANLKRMLLEVPPRTIVAPGHGPMTTAENELRYNPFVV
jgi:hydroxyacylglutathione hydrolase